MANKAPNFKDLIIYEDQDYLIINKPPFLSTLEDRVDNFNVSTLAKEYLENATPCHRLDKDTSGALVLSKNEDAYKNLARKFEKREVEKVYHAIADGRHEIDPMLIEAPLGNLIRGKVKVDFQDGKPSATKIRTSVIYKQHTLIECKPITGRTHQIRAHLAHIGAPIACDTMYGGKEAFLSDLKRKFNLKKGTEELPLIKRFALHAYSISFKDLNGKTLSVHAPYPKDYEVLVKQLERNTK
jgi:23S rRNA pseudouridine955/2504/2580 synthase